MIIDKSSVIVTGVEIIASALKTTTAFKFDGAANTLKIKTFSIKNSNFTGQTFILHESKTLDASVFSLDQFFFLGSSMGFVTSTERFTSLAISDFKCTKLGVA
jgi:hypothetical protein